MSSVEIGCLELALSSSGKQVLAKALEQSSPSSAIVRFTMALMDEKTRLTVLMPIPLSIN